MTVSRRFELLVFVAGCERESLNRALDQSAEREIHMLVGGGLLSVFVSLLSLGSH